MTERFRSRGASAALPMVALLAGALLAGAPREAAAQDLNADQRAQMYYRVKPAVVMVRWDATAEVAVNGQRITSVAGGTGSGWVITPDGYVVTNGHVVMDYHDRKRLSVELVRDALQQAGLFRGLSEEEQQSVLEASLPEELGLTPMRPRRRAGGGPERRGAAPGPASVTVTLIGQPTARLWVVLQNGRQYAAEVRAYSPPIGTSPGSVAAGPELELRAGGRDVAVLKVAGENLPIVKLGDSDQVEIGATVHAAGYPGVVSNHQNLGAATRLEASFTEGRISSRKVDVQGSSLLQMTAPITWGNSGGPLFNDGGEVVGMSTLGSIAMQNPTGVPQVVQGFNFAVPVNVVREFVRDAGVDLSRTSAFNQVWERALDRFRTGDYHAAISDANTALSLLQGMPDAERLRTLAIQRSGGDVGTPEAPQPEPASTAPPTSPSPSRSTPWFLIGIVALALVMIPAGLALRGRGGVAATAAPLRSLPRVASAGHLVVSAGPQRGSRIAIPLRGMTIGRDPSRNHLVLDDEAVSRTHALVTRSAEGADVLVRNLSQTNPTLINDQPVQEMVLRNGDRIKVGNSVMVFESE